MMKRSFYFFILIAIIPFFVDATSPKAFWNSVTSLPFLHKQFWNKIGDSVEGMFGKSPTGYSYSCTVHNDTDQDMYFATQGLISLLGGVFPQANSFEVVTVKPFGRHEMVKQPLFFYMLLKTTDKAYVNKLPYVNHDDVLFQKVFAAPDSEFKTSDNVDHYRFFMGKKLRGGKYEYAPAVELVGTRNSSAKKGSQGLTFTTQLSSISIKNETSEVYQIGFFEDAQKAYDLSKASLKSHISKHVYATWPLSSTKKSFCQGTLALFNQAGTELLTKLDAPVEVFENFSYNVIIYKDDQEKVHMGWQGLTLGNGDFVVSDGVTIAPVPITVWVQSVAQSGNAQGMQDLPGKVWTLIMTDKAGFALGSLKAGESLTTDLKRVQGSQTWLFWVYVDEPDEKKEQLFINNCIKTIWTNTTVQLYMHNALHFLDKAENTIVMNNYKPTSSGVVGLTQELLQSSLHLHKGKIVDSESQVTGYLLGMDGFCSTGLSWYMMNYIIAPSYQNDEQLPTSAVQSVYMEEVVHGSGVGAQLLAGMPKATQVTYPLF